MATVIVEGYHPVKCINLETLKEEFLKCKACEGLFFKVSKQTRVYDFLCTEWECFSCGSTDNETCAFEPEYPVPPPHPFL